MTGMTPGPLQYVIPFHGKCGHGSIKSRRKGDRLPTVSKDIYTPSFVVGWRVRHGSYTSMLYVIYRNHWQIITVLSLLQSITIVLHNGLGLAIGWPLSP